jgi:hypothetical protein
MPLLAVALGVPEELALLVRDGAVALPGDISQRIRKWAARKHAKEHERKELLAHVDAVAEEHGLYAGALKAAVWAERLVCGPRGNTEL